MLFTRDALKPSLYASLGLIPTLYGRRLGLLRTGAALSLVLVLGAYLVTSPIGSNAERLALLFAAPIAIGWSRLPRAALLLVLVPLIWWGERNVRQELVRSRDASAQESYYQPLIDRLSAAPVPAGWRSSIRVRTGPATTSPGTCRSRVAGNVRSTTPATRCSTGGRP